MYNGTPLYNGTPEMNLNQYITRGPSLVYRNEGIIYEWDKSKDVRCFIVQPFNIISNMYSMFALHPLVMIIHNYK